MPTVMEHGEDSNPVSSAGAYPGSYESEPSVATMGSGETGDSYCTASSLQQQLH